MALTKVGKDGIIGVSNSADANALFIDSSERVGVGATPNATFGSHLYAQGTPAANKPIISAYSQGNSNKAGIGILNDAGNRGIWTDSNDFLLTTSYEGNSAVHMKIDTNGIMTVLSEGRAVTTSVQQGLCKCWIHLTGTGTPAAADSFNVASVTDSSTGRYTINIANDFGNANYTCAGMVGNDGTTASAVGTAIDLTPTAGEFAIRNLSGGSENDFANVLLNFHGDLA